MKYGGLYHLNAYTYADPEWFPDMDPKLREMFQKVTKGALSGNAGEAPREDFKINGQYVNTPDQGVVGIPFFDDYVEKASLDYLDRNGKSGQPFFMSINFMKVHQPNMPAPEFIHKYPFIIIIVRSFLHSGPRTEGLTISGARLHPALYLLRTYYYSGNTHPPRLFTNERKTTWTCIHEQKNLLQQQHHHINTSLNQSIHCHPTILRIACKSSKPTLPSHRCAPPTTAGASSPPTLESSFHQPLR